MSTFGVEQTQGTPGVTDHGLLTGLADNDHPQYRLVTGDADIGVTAVGANQAAAYAITKRLTVVTGGNTAGVRLPASVAAGDFYIVVNATGTNPAAGLGNYINTYPASGDTIRPNAVNVRNYQVANSVCFYVSRGDGTWQCGTMDMKSDHVSRTIGDFPYFYGATSFYNGVTISTGGTFSCSVAGSFSSSLTATNAFLLTGAITPSALGAGPTADYAPTGFANVSAVRQDMSAAGSISGLAGGGTGRCIHLLNVATNASYTLTLLHDDAGSTAGNRFYLPGNASLVVPNNSGVKLWYDTASSRWRVVGGV